MRAKFHAESVTKHSGGVTSALLMPVRKGPSDSENTQFWQATPIGKLEITITNPAVQEFFEAGKEYYLDFTQCEHEQVYINTSGATNMSSVSNASNFTSLT